MGAGASADVRKTAEAELSNADPATLTGFMRDLSEADRKKIANALNEIETATPKTDTNGSSGNPAIYAALLERRKCFTKAVDEVVKGGESPDKIKEEILETRKRLITEMRGDLAESEKKKTMAMLTLLQEQLGTAQSLPVNWENEMKWYDDKAMCAGMDINYGGAEVKAEMILVTTDLTRSMRKNFFDAFSQKKNILAKGPPGTGKTETFRDIIRSLAIKHEVVDCSENVTLDAIREASEKADWLMFDIANKLPEGVAKDAAALLKVAGKNYVVTINSAEPDALPESFKSDGMCCEFTVPPLPQILDCMLSVGGFLECVELGCKLVSVFEKCKANDASKAPGADYGLRAMKATVDAASTAFKQAEHKGEEKDFVARAIYAHFCSKCEGDAREFAKGTIKDDFGIDFSSE